MNKKNKYHIDVTPEEDELFRDKPTRKGVLISRGLKFTNKSIIVFVVVVHFVGALTLLAFTPKKQQDIVKVESTQEPISEIAPISVPAPSPVLPVQQFTSVSGKTPISTQTVTYTVKSGDTFYSIVKKYKLNSDSLIKLNNIQDPSKLRVGQVLKFK